MLWEMATEVVYKYFLDNHLMALSEIHLFLVQLFFSAAESFNLLVFSMSLWPYWVMSLIWLPMIFIPLQCVLSWPSWSVVGIKSVKHIWESLGGWVSQCVHASYVQEAQKVLIHKLPEISISEGILILKLRGIPICTEIILKLQGISMWAVRQLMYSGSHWPKPWLKQGYHTSYDRRNRYCGYFMIIKWSFSAALRKNICCEYSLGSPWWSNSNEHPQHMFLWRNMKNYPLIIIK